MVYQVIGKIAQANAKNALTKNGLNKISIKDQNTYKTLFGISSTRPLQKYTDEIALHNTAQLFILEDMTGAGKTEAALMLAYRLMKLRAVYGMYFGLPTMATANGIYRRVNKIGQHFFY